MENEMSCMTLCGTCRVFSFLNTEKFEHEEKK